MKNGKRTVKNALWIIACKVVQSVLTVLITMLIARKYGASDFGLINYAAAVVAFAAPVMKLGFTSTLVQELVEEPEQEGQILGTALVMNLGSALLSMAGVAAFAAVANPGERETILVCVLYSLNLPFQALEMIQYWFQARQEAKYPSLMMLFAYFAVTAYKVFLLATDRSIYWFAVSQALDFCMISAGLLVIYRRLGGQRFRFSRARGREMFSRSRYYIISSLMITIFAQTDKIMLKSMLGSAATGYYSAAVGCATMTSFVFTAIVDSAKPAILGAKKVSREDYESQLTVLYSLVIYLALAQSLGITLLARPIVGILYGEGYLAAVPVLRVVVWFTTFSYLGSARTVWILGEKKHALLWRVNLWGAVCNVLLNWALIPVWGALGAALASLATQMFTNLLIGFIMPSLRANNALVLRSLDPRRLTQAVRNLLGRSQA